MNPKLKKDYTLTLLKPDAKFKKGDIITFEFKNNVYSDDYAEEWLLDIKRTAFTIIAISNKTITKVVTLDQCGGPQKFSNGIWKANITQDDWKIFNIYKLTKKLQVNTQNQRLADLIL